MRTETIKIAGGDVEQTITVRSTVHGPILSDAIEYVGRGGRNAHVNGRSPQQDPTRSRCSGPASR